MFTNLVGSISGETFTDNPTTVQYLAENSLGYTLSYFGTKFDVIVKSPMQHSLSKYMKEKPKLDTSRVILSPMPGTVVAITVKEGDVVAEGSEVLVVEAMKMQNVLRAPRAGKIKKILVISGQSVAADEILVEFEGDVPSLKK